MSHFLQDDIKKYSAKLITNDNILIEYDPPEGLIFIICVFSLPTAHLHTHNYIFPVSFLENKSFMKQNKIKNKSNKDQNIIKLKSNSNQWPPRIRIRIRKEYIFLLYYNYYNKKEISNY